MLTRFWSLTFGTIFGAMSSALRACLLPLILFAACSGKGSNNDAPSDGGQKIPPSPELPTSTSDDAKSTPNGGAGEKHPEIPKPVDPGAEWKNYRATFDTVQVNGVKPCADEDPCLSFGRRLIGKWYEPESGKLIPQIVGWDFILSRSGAISTSLELPIFADRGEMSSKDGMLSYHFKGPVYNEDIGSGTVEFTATLQPQPDGTTKIIAIAKFASMDINKVFILKERPGTRLIDVPQGIRNGLIAIKEEIGKSGERTEGMVCKIWATPGARFLLDARYYLHNDGNLLFWRGIYTDRHYGIFDHVLAAQSSKATVAPNQGDGFTRYYASFDMTKTENVDIPIYGVGAKNVKTDFKDAAKLTAAVDKICDDVK